MMDWELKMYGLPTDTPQDFLDIIEVLRAFRFSDESELLDAIVFNFDYKDIAPAMRDIRMLAEAIYVGAPGTTFQIKSGPSWLISPSTMEMTTERSVAGRFGLHAAKRIAAMMESVGLEVELTLAK